MPEREQHQHDELDLLLDESLSSYGEPAVGMEVRVRTSVMHQIYAARRRTLFLATALPLAACLLLALILPRLPHRKSGTAAPMAKAESSPSEQPRPLPLPGVTVPSSTSNRHKVLKEPMHFAVALPRRDVFPTPAPLTAQEQVLVRFVAGAPEPERRLVLEQYRKLSEPLHIAAIEIPPIPPPKQGIE